MTIPLGARLCEVVGNEASGGYRILSLLDREGPTPQPGQFYALAGGSEIPIANAAPTKRGARLDFLLECVEPDPDRRCELEGGERIATVGPLGDPLPTPKQVDPGAAGAILVGGGVGIAPMAIWRRYLVERGIPLRVLLGFRDPRHSGGLDELFCAGGSLCPDVRVADESGRIGHHGAVTDLLASMLAGDDATSAVVYACGSPEMGETVRLLCEKRGVPCRLLERSRPPRADK
jgi:dihydroorotate dehydrogenase electron transfer subunit